MLGSLFSVERLRSKKTGLGLSEKVFYNAGRPKANTSIYDFFDACDRQRD